MITLTKNGNAIVFTFEDNAHYLFDGTIAVPINSLTLITDNSQMATFKKSASNDIFISARYDELGMSKAELESWFKENACGSTGGGGGGVTSGEVETMIEASLEDYYDIDEVDTALANKADTSAVTAVADDVSTVSGQVATKVATSDFNTYSAATDARIAEDEEVTAAALNSLDETKQGKLAYYEENTSGKTATIHIENTDDGTVGEVYVDGASVDISALRTEEDEDNGSMVETHSDINGNNAGIAMSYEKLVDDEEAAHSYLNVEEGLISMEVMANEETTNVDVTSTGVTINGDAVATEPYVDDVISGKVDTSAITSSVTSASTDTEIPTAKATYDAIQAGGGGGATYSAGTNISIANDTINCTLPIETISNSYGTRQIYIGDNIHKNNNYGAIVIANKDDSSTGETSVEFAEGAISIGSTNKVFRNGIAIGTNATAGAQNIWGCVAIGLNAAATGTTKMNLNNQIKVDTNNQVYIKDKTNTTDVCIQDAIAALGGLKFVKLTQAEYDQLATKDANTLYIISNVVS